MSGQGGATLNSAKGVPLHAQSVWAKFQATGGGAFIRNCTEGTNGAVHSITGGGAALLEQQNQAVAVNGFVTRVPIAAMRVPVTTAGNLSTATNLPLPDFTGVGTQTTSLYKIGQTTTDNVDWQGGFTGIGQDGTFFEIFNESSGTGFGLNVVDGSLGGSMACPFPYQYLGYLGKLRGFWNGSTPRVDFVSPSRISGSLVGGSRICTVASGATTMVYQQTATAASGGLPAFTSAAKIAAYTTTNHVLGLWQDATYAWDESRTQIAGTVVTATTGIPDTSFAYVTGGGSPTVALTNDFSGGSLFRFLITNNTAGTIVVTVSGWTTAICPF